MKIRIKIRIGGSESENFYENSLPLILIFNTIFTSNSIRYNFQSNELCSSLPIVNET